MSHSRATPPCNAVEVVQEAGKSGYSRSCSRALVNGDQRGKMAGGGICICLLESYCQ